MASASYYYGLMIQYSREKRKVEEKKEKWVAYVPKLSNFSSALSNIISSVSSCNSNLLGGGYLEGEGVSLDHGKLSEIISKLENDSTILSGVITKCQGKIDEFTNRIEELTRLYNDANSNYIAAKRREEMEQ